MTTRMMLMEKLSGLNPAEKTIVRNAVFGHDLKLSLSILQLYFSGISIEDVGILRELLK